MRTASVMRHFLAVAWRLSSSSSSTTEQLLLVLLPLSRWYPKRCRNMDLSRMIHLSVVVVVLFARAAVEGRAPAEVIWAVNAGGDFHEDVNGIKYQKDVARVGTASDYGKSLLIHRVPQQDQILYQTERYHTGTFGYDIPIARDGDYVLVLKFSEVWFSQPEQKVFSVNLNKEHTIVEDLDIFGKVGRGVAHDEIIPFSVKNGMLKVGGESSVISNNRIVVEFIKQTRDNPKINAMYVIRGSVDDVPMLPPMPGLDQREEEEEEEDIEEEVIKPKKKRTISGPKVQDPYAADDTGSMMLPVVVAIGAFLPLLFCLCKL